MKMTGAALDDVERHHAGKNGAVGKRCLQDPGITYAVLETHHYRIGPGDAGERFARLGGGTGFHCDQDEIGRGSDGRIDMIADLASREPEVGAKIVGEAQAVLHDLLRQPLPPDKADAAARRRQPAADIAADAAGTENADAERGFVQIRHPSMRR